LTPIFGFIHIYWLVLPLVVAISLVYSASRYEPWHKIWKQSIWLCSCILGLLLFVTVLLLFINTRV
jgi:hypothetical protein